MRKVLLLTLGLCLVLSGSSFAFHDGGVAHCNGCHTMHNSQDGVLVDGDSPLGNDMLLTDATPSDVCLGCHATGYNKLLAGNALTPDHTLKGAGSFIFLTALNLNDGHAGATHPISGDAAGHNLNAPGHGLSTDATLTMAPGGGYPATSMACTSCHDPHGTANFRLLYGSEKAGFNADAPIADRTGPIYYGGVEGNASHTAYKSGMSEWCANCHGVFHSQIGTNYTHPVDYSMDGVKSVYDAYNGTDDQTGGDNATAYLAAVPFEDPAMTTTTVTGPVLGTSEVMCLTCHRAHGSSAPDAGRWDFSVTFLAEDGLESTSYPIPDPYASPNQRSLCNKCHNKDVGDAPAN